MSTFKREKLLLTVVDLVLTGTVPDADTSSLAGRYLEEETFGFEDEDEVCRFTELKRGRIWQGCGGGGGGGGGRRERVGKRRRGAGSKGAERDAGRGTRDAGERGAGKLAGEGKEQLVPGGRGDTERGGRRPPHLDMPGVSAQAEPQKPPRWRLP
ncbi:hypothetical protein RUM44_003963 [Polyplax serrata]|uniref:Uncharacterized protein n=1 Tax=Polyplax serrata TaxID=468196 RepID=A0ABR1B272_POLSC